MTDVAPISVGETWTLAPADGLGTGIGAIPAGAQVVVDAVWPPFSPGVAAVDEDTIVCLYSFDDFDLGPGGALVEATNERRLAFAESDFRALFTPGGGA